MAVDSQSAVDGFNTVTALLFTLAARCSLGVVFNIITIVVSPSVVGTWPSDFRGFGYSVPVTDSAFLALPVYLHRFTNIFLL